MQIPQFFYGSYADVKMRCKKIIKRIARGEAWQEIIGTENVVDTQNLPGLIVLNGPNPMLNAYGSHFHCYVLLDQVMQELNKRYLASSIEDSIFEESAKTEWGTLGLLAYKNIMWFTHSQHRYSFEQWQTLRYQPLLFACLQHWDSLNSEGARYTNGLNEPQKIWDLPTSLKYVLANMSVPIQILNSPLPEEGLASLVNLARTNCKRSNL